VVQRYPSVRAAARSRGGPPAEGRRVRGLCPGPRTRRTGRSAGLPIWGGRQAG